MTASKALLALLLTSTALPAFAQTKAEDADTERRNDQPDLEEIVVTGRAQEFYRVDETTLNNKYPGDLSEIAQAIQIIPSQLIEDQAAIEITDLYRNISSVSIFSYSGVTFRGFRQDEVRYDGLLGDPFAGFTVPLLFDVARLEIIKGPTAALFGSGEPGGVINYVTKGPGEEFGGLVRGVAGTFNLYGVEAEASGPLDKNGELLFRLGGAFQNTDTFRFNTNKQDFVLGGDVLWQPSPDTRLILKVDFVDQDFQGARLRGVPVDDDGNFLTTIEFNTNETNDFQRIEATAFTTRFDQAITEDLGVTLAGRVVLSEERQNYHEPRGLFDQGGTLFMRREFRDQTRDVEQYTGLAEVTYGLDLGPTRHSFLLGGEWFRRSNEDFFLTSIDEVRAAGLGLPSNFAVPSLNFLNPNFGRSNPVLFDPIDERDRTIRSTRWSLYAQDRIDITDELIVTLGGRLEGFEEEVDQIRTNLATGLASESADDFSDEALTFRGGAVYKVTEAVSPYFTFSQGFTPQSAAAQEPEAGGPFEPERSRLFEVGAKGEFFGDRLFVQTALYQINKTNILVADPTPGAPTGALSSIGEARSRGVELDMIGDVTDDWAVVFNYAFNETEILEGADEVTNAVGNEFANAPDHQMGLWTRYDVRPINTAFNFGLEYVSERVSLSGQRVQPYVIFDTGLITSWDYLTLQLNVRNLFDKEYAESGFIERTGHFPGTPRTFRVELTADF